MAIPNLLQATQGTSTASATPASITKAITASQVGSTIIAHVAGVFSAAPGISTPANFSLLQTVIQGTILAAAWFAYPNNPGGVASVVSNLTNCTGAAIIVWEFDQLDIANLVPETLLGPTNASSTAPATGVVIPQTENMLYIGAIDWEGDIGGALTPGNTGVWTAETLRTSTTGAHTVSSQPYRSAPGGGVLPQQLQLAGTLTAAPWIASLLGIRTTSASKASMGPGGGLMVPQFYQGLIGG